jgi:Xaa-Pro aminopeptidase
VAAPDAARLRSRRTRLRALADGEGLGAMLITAPANIRWLTGFTGSYGALVQLPGRDVLITDGRYRDQAGWQAPGVEIEVAPADRIGAAAALLEPEVTETRPAGFEPSGLLWSEGDRLRELVGAATPAPALVEELREVKDDTELASIRAAARAGMDALDAVLPALAPGVTELEVARRLELAMRDAGAEGVAFDSIVAFGPNAAEPHHLPTSRALARGDLVKLDFGAAVDGYRSDMTRTVVLGPASARQREVYEVVRAAQAAGLATLRDGVTGGEIDAACRDLITAAGLGEAFSHPTGHGVGLEIHEAPRVRARAGGSIAAGTPLTVEPGVYIPGFGGVRIEDLAVVAPDGHELLTTTTKDLLEL